jgi:hypothetical protein
MATGTCPTSSISIIQGNTFLVKIFYSLVPQCNPSDPDGILPNVSEAKIIDEPPIIQDTVFATNGELLIAQKDAGGHFSIDPSTGDLFVNDVDADRYSIDADGYLIYDPCA